MKRAKHSTPNSKNPFNYELSSKGTHKYCITASFSIPAEDEECPLTLDKISESKLCFLPETPFLLDRPKHCKLTLPCGHSFSAMTLVYSFCKSGMVCPYCRAGREMRADVDCLPRHLRADFKVHLQQVMRQERDEDEETAINDLISSTGYVSIMPYSSLAFTRCLSLSMEFYNTASTLPLSSAASPVFSMNTLLMASDSDLPFLEPRADLRAISHMAHMGVNAIRLSVMLSLRGTGSVQVDATALTPLPHVDDESSCRCLTIPGLSSMATTEQNGRQVTVQLQSADAGGTRFSVFFSQTATFPHLLIRNIVWHPGNDTLAVAVSGVSMADLL